MNQALAACSSNCTCRSCRVVKDMAALAQMKEQLAFLRAELAANPRDLYLQEEIDSLADQMWRLKAWIDGGK